jgi:2-amino-4-hydroxy-6-hydroxymethyldihydropteridine diphosphokinase
MTLHTAWIALGANLGPRQDTLARALGALERALGATARASSLWETEPRLDLDQPAFLNAVVALPTALDPHALLQTLQAIERAAGRDRDPARPKGPRALDLDLLALGPLVVDSPDLTLPHPALALRRFVLAPWAELDPRALPPKHGRSVAELLARCPEQGWVRKLGPLLPLSDDPTAPLPAPPQEAP